MAIGAQKFKPISSPMCIFDNKNNEKDVPAQTSDSASVLETSLNHENFCRSSLNSIGFGGVAGNGLESFLSTNKGSTVFTLL